MMLILLEHLASYHDSQHKLLVTLLLPPNSRDREGGRRGGPSEGFHDFNTTIRYALVYHNSSTSKGCLLMTFTRIVCAIRLTHFLSKQSSSLILPPLMALITYKHICGLHKGALLIYPILLHWLML